MPGAIYSLPPTSIVGSLNPVDAMIDLTATLIGQKDDLEARDLALRYLDRAADRMNQLGIWLFGRKEKTYTSTDGDFSDGTSTLSPPNDFAWGCDGIRCLKSGGELASTPEWISWHHFKPMFDRDPDAQGAPEYFSLLNEFDDKIYVYSTINTGDVASIVMPYYSRIIRPSESVGDDLLLTNEAREAMLTGAEFFVMRQRHSAKPAIWQPFQTDFELSMRRARGASHRQQQVLHSWAVPDEQGRVTASYLGRPGTGGAVYVAIY